MNLRDSVYAPVVRLKKIWQYAFGFFKLHFFREMKCIVLLVVKFNIKMYIPHVFLPNCKFYIPRYVQHSLQMKSALWAKSKQCSP